MYLTLLSWRTAEIILEEVNISVLYRAVGSVHVKHDTSTVQACYNDTRLDRRRPINLDLPTTTPALALAAENSEERYRLDLNTLAHGRVRGQGGVLKGAVAEEAGAAVSLRLVGLQEQDLVRCHFREVPPLMLR